MIHICFHETYLHIYFHRLRRRRRLIIIITIIIIYLLIYYLHKMSNENVKQCTDWS